MKDIFSLKNINIFLIGIVVIIITFLVAKLYLISFVTAMIIKMLAHEDCYKITDRIIKIILYSSIFIGALFYVVAFYFGWISSDFLIHFHPSLMRCVVILAINCLAIFIVEVVFWEE